MHYLKIILLKLNRYLSFFRFYPIDTVRGVMQLPIYLINLVRFQRSCSDPITINPSLYDRHQNAGNLSEYFYQDTYIANKIIELNPLKHIDVGGRIDGFISILSVYRNIDVYDIRPLDIKNKNISFKRVNILDDISQANIADCVSCLHTLEHIGLGRYGDPIDVNGWGVAIKNLVKLLKSKGCLWISVPCGYKRVEFDSHRVFNPLDLTEHIEALGCKLVEFSYLDKNQIVTSNLPTVEMKKISEYKYTLCIFKFEKI